MSTAQCTQCSLSLSTHLLGVEPNARGGELVGIAELLSKLLGAQALVDVAAVALEEQLDRPPEVLVELGVDDRVH